MNRNQASNGVIDENKNSISSPMEKSIKFLLPAIGIGIILILVTLALAAATLAIVNIRLKETTTTTNQPSLGSEYAESIRISDAMTHLNELQRIATANNGNRAVNTLGFNQTLDYIYDSLSTYTNFKITKTYFYLRDFVLTSNPILLTSINGEVKNRTFSYNLATAEFYFIQYTATVNFSSYFPISVIPNLGCSDDDWLATSPSPSGRVALVKRGICTFVEKAAFASKYNVTALLIYNDGTTPDRVPPISIGLGQNNELPALFLSYTLGQELAIAAQNTSTNTGVQLIIPTSDQLPYPVGNICADTPTGDATQTIVIGSHSDSVPAGPGINDNGSGSAANLALAVALARLFQTSTYAKYKYRVRFCWWGAEELGLLGSDFHVKQAKNSTVVGERLSDYLINLNYDMLGSPNYIFGIYDGNTANNDTPAQARPGSNKITSLFKNWFDQQNLPWDYTDFSGRSDYGPFLAEGIVAGGLFSGADGIKSQEERDYYDRLLGQGMGGISDTDHDPCYHKACDSIQNINQFAYEKLIQAAAYTLEYLARQSDLRTWLYPEGRPLSSTAGGTQRPKYNSINEYFKMPYL